MGVFPYLLLIGWPSVFPNTLLWILLIIGNIAIAAMLAMMAYSVAFIGALTPDRVIKYRMVRFLLRGPLTAILALIMFGVGVTLEPKLGLGRYSLSLVVMAGTVIAMQLGVELAKPLIDLALYREGTSGSRPRTGVEPAIAHDGGFAAVSGERPRGDVRIAAQQGRLSGDSGRR